MRWETTARQTLDQYRTHWTVRLVQNYFADDADGLASIVAFAAIFSLMPILIVTFMCITLLLQLDLVKDALSGLVAENVPLYIEDRIDAVVQGGSDNLTSLGIVTLITFLLGGSKLYSAIDRACATIFQTKRQPYARRKLFAIFMMPVIPALLLAATLLSAVATAVVVLPIEKVTNVDPSKVDALIGYLVAFLLGFGLMMLAYWRIPEHGPGLRHAATGAAVSAVLLVMLAQFFPLYVKLTGGYSVYSSAFAFILLLMFWLYLVGQIFVIGAEVAAFRAGRRGNEQ